LLQQLLKDKKKVNRGNKQRCKGKLKGDLMLFTCPPFIFLFTCLFYKPEQKEEDNIATPA